MKKVLALVIALALVLTVMAVPSFAADNVLENPDFYEDASGWGGWVTWAYDFADHTGDEDSGSVYYGAEVPHGHCSQDIDFAAGTTYYFSGYVKVSSDYQMSTAGFNGICLGIGTGGQWELHRVGYINSNENLPYDWTRIEGSWTCEEDVTACFSAVCWGKQAGEVWFDDLYLGTEPDGGAATGDASVAAVAVVAVALVGTVVFARRKETV